MLRPVALAACVLLLAVSARAGGRVDPPPPKVAAAAWQAAESGPAEILIRLKERADLSAAESLPSREDRALFVHMALRATAERSQAGLRAWLAAANVEYRPFVIVNLVWARADRGVILALAARPEVESIVFNPWVKGLTDTIVPGLPGNPGTPSAVEWNVSLIGAPAVWAQGFRGEGLVVGDQDTGIRWTHDLIKAAYRGWDAGSGTTSHDYNWHDSIHAPASGGVCGPDSLEPCDDHSHGTHTVGTILGADVNGNETGVAPGARWIGCRNMDQGWGSPATYLECFEFFLAPYPVGGDTTMGDPLRAPDVTSNSWACPPAEGCAWDVLEDAVKAQRAAGIMTVVAAGNSGSACGSISDPPALYDSAFTVGASNSSDNIAGFSSRGPTTPNGLMKPDIVAPGVNIRSGTNASDSSFASWNGTSMATPHVAGAVALIWSARPSYRGHIAETEDLLTSTALRLPAIVEACGGDYVAGPNGTWGHGRIDLAAALAAACPPIESLCTDAFDSDCDGALDCADADCDGDPACREADWCADGRDNDLDGATDCDDADCDGIACVEAGRCADGRDNDQDGATDCVDDDCDGDAACPESAWCADGRDNDRDGAVDCDDTDCDGIACAETGRCADARDNDGDTLADCTDADCDGDAACPESAWCADGRDNDQDGAADCDDPDCDGIGCVEAGRCADGRDNDRDGVTDCVDDDCDGDVACPESAWCADGRDNDRDGAVDCDDADCDGIACAEAGRCADARDNDGDTLTDCADDDCDGDAACPESAWCADARDNDRDGAIDCDDADCDGIACMEAGRCADGRDNDQDGAVDCLDVDCDGDASCPESAWCADGRDNDLDGAIDCDDADCDGVACVETGRCADGRDNDQDGAADCADLECVRDPACDASDFDGDGRANSADCLPVDGTVFDAAPAVGRIDLREIGPFTVITWPTVAASSGSGTRYEVAGGPLSLLSGPGPIAPPCIATSIPGEVFVLWSTSPDEFFLVRAVTPCGPGPAQSWGTDSFGRPIPACP